MKRLNLKLAISLVIGTIVMVAGVLIAHDLQQGSTAGTLKKQRDEINERAVRLEKECQALKEEATRLVAERDRFLERSRQRLHKPLRCA